jgi:hypothetical protein
MVTCHKKMHFLLLLKLKLNTLRKDSTGEAEEARDKLKRNCASGVRTPYESRVHNLLKSGPGRRSGGGNTSPAGLAVACQCRDP